MKTVRFLVISLLLSISLLPATALAAGGTVVRAGVFPEANAAQVLVARASAIYGVSVSVTNATGRYGGRASCLGTSNPVTSLISAACVRAGGSYVTGTVTTTTATGSEFAAGRALLAEAGIISSTTSAHGVVSPTKVMTGQASLLTDSVTYLQLTPTTAMTMPTTAADAQRAALAMFPKLASAQFLPVRSRPGTYAFFARSFPAGFSSAGRAVQDIRALLIVFTSNGKTTFGAVVASGGAATSLHS